MLGFNLYDGFAVSDFKTLVFATRVPLTQEKNKNVYVNFVIDLNCNINNPDWAIVVVDFMLADAGNQGQWNTYTVDSSEAIFKSVGGKGGLPSHLANGGATLGTLSDANTQACFANGDPQDNGMPKDTVLDSILLVLGDSGTTALSEIHIDDVEISFETSVILYDFEPES